MRDIQALFKQQQGHLSPQPKRSKPEEPEETNPRTFTFEPTPAHAAAINHGTVNMIPNGLTRSMEEEFKGSAFESDYNYVVYGSASDAPRESKWTNRQNCIRDEGHENWTLEDFCLLPRVKAAGLTMAEVAMLRIYSTAGRTLNLLLREEKSAEPFATSISILTSAVIKLSAHAPVQPIFRSIPNATLHSSVPDGPVSRVLVHVDNAFSSATHSIDVAFTYAGAPNLPAVVFCIDASWSSRCGVLSEISQYPQENEALLPPCTALEITEVTSIGPKKLLQCTPHVCTMRHYTNDLLFPWSSPIDPLTKAELEELTQLWTQRLQLSAQETSKFCATARDFILGEPKIAALGLEEYMKQTCSAHTCDDAIAAIEQEFLAHGTDEDREWFDYIKHHAASEQAHAKGTRDKGRAPVALADFAAMDEAKVAHLHLAHVLALRLYTSPAFNSLNIPLRTYKHDAEGNMLRPPEMNAAHNFPVTVFYIRDAISKLRAVESVKGTSDSCLCVFL
jgi:hypothetical protein